MATTSFSPSAAAARSPCRSPVAGRFNPGRLICLLPISLSPPPAARWRVRRPAAPLRLAPRRRAVRCGAIVQIGQSEFPTEVLDSELPVLVEFVAEWCGPCRLISSVVEWASQEYKDKLKIVKIDHDANPELITEYKVYGLPTLMLFKHGKEVPESRREGAITKVKIKEYLDGFLEPSSVA